MLFRRTYQYNGTVILQKETIDKVNNMKTMLVIPYIL